MALSLIGVFKLNIKMFVILTFSCGERLPAKSLNPIFDGLGYFVYSHNYCYFRVNFNTSGCVPDGI